MDGSNPNDRLDDATKDEASEGKFWAEQIRKAGDTERDWRRDSDRVQERYRNEKRRHKTTFPIFWSNVQVLKPNVYSALPRPDVRRRAVHEDPLRRDLGKQAAIVVENGLKYEIDNAGFGQAMEAARDDMLIVGRGVVREVYASDTVKKRDLVLANPSGGGEMIAKKEAGYVNDSPEELTACQRCSMFRGPSGCSLVKGEISPGGHCNFWEQGVYMRAGALVEPDGFEDGVPFIEVVENRRTESRYVFWADYRQSPARCWQDVWWVAFRHAMDNDELAEEFPDVDPKTIPKVLVANTEKSSEPRVEDMPPDPASPFNRAEVWEIWNKLKKERIWVATGYEDHVLRKDPDPLRVAGFFPMPKPLYAVPTNDSMVPMPELQVYECLADELDEVQDRLRKLTKLAKFVGLHAGDLVEMQNLANMTDGQFAPILRPEVLPNDIKGAIWAWPIGEIVQAIAVLRIQSQELRDAIYELTGISDLRRGIGQERESATAQKLKASYGAARMTPRSKPMAEFIRDLLRIKAEIMVEHFDQATLELVSGAPIDPMVLDLLREERLRQTTIDIETDSTVAPDAEAEKAEAVEFASAVTELTTAWGPLLQAAPPIAGPLYGALLRTTTQRFKFARNLEETIDQTVALLSAMPMQPPAMAGPGGMLAPPVAGNGAVPEGMVQ